VPQAQWYTLPIALQTMHVLGAGVWIGGLFVLLVGRPRPRRSVTRVPAGRALVNAFSPSRFAVQACWR
jgi:putative copper export protein